MVRRFHSKPGKAAAVLRGPSSTETLRKGRFSFRGAARQRGVSGWAGGLWLSARFSNSRLLLNSTQSYPKLIFLAVGHVQQAPVCQAKQYVATRGLTQMHLQTERPGQPTQPGRGCCPQSPVPRELGSVLGSLLEYRLDSYMKFACLK